MRVQEALASSAGTGVKCLKTLDQTQALVMHLHDGLNVRDLYFSSHTTITNHKSFEKEEYINQRMVQIAPTHRTRQQGCPSKTVTRLARRFYAKPMNSTSIYQVMYDKIFVPKEEPHSVSKTVLCSKLTMFELAQ